MEATIDNTTHYDVEVTVDEGEPKGSCLFPKILLNGHKRALFFDTSTKRKRAGIRVLCQR